MHLNLYHPAPLHAALESIQSSAPDLHSSTHTFTLNVKSLYHGPPTPLPVSTPTVALENSFAVIPTTAQGTSIKTGDAEELRRQTEIKEEKRRMEENREKAYQRKIRLEGRHASDDYGNSDCASGTEDTSGFAKARFSQFSGHLFY